MVAQSARFKIHAIRQDFIGGISDSLELATKLGLCATTVNKHRKEFREISRLYPDQLANFKFRLPKVKYVKPIDPRFPELINMLPSLMERSTTLQVQLIPLWQDYRILKPMGYSLQQFTIHYIDWRRKTGACIYVHRRLREIQPADLAELEKWRSSNHNNRWKRATVLLGH
jgi:hypothetical protein